MSYCSFLHFFFIFLLLDEKSSSGEVCGKRVMTKAEMSCEVRKKANYMYWPSPPLPGGCGEYPPGPEVGTV